MTTTLTTAGSWAGYFVLAFIAARLVYSRVRPYREPLRCLKEYSHSYDGSKHDAKCYRQVPIKTPYSKYCWWYDTRDGAVLLSITAAWIWPLTLAAAILIWLAPKVWAGILAAITGRTPERPAETAVRWKRERAAMKTRIAELEAEKTAWEASQ